MIGFRARIVVVLAVVLWAAGPARALTADQIVLIVNRAEPAGAELARFYAQARGIDPDRILELDLPTTEEMPFDRYERDVVPPVREFLRRKGLDQSVRCLVTFYGVPLRISNRENGPAENIELRSLRETMSRVTARLQGLAAELEEKAAELDPAFKPPTADTTLEAMVRRAAVAGQVIDRAVARTTDADARQQLVEYLRQMTAKLTSPLDPADAAPGPASAPSAEMLERLYDPAVRQAVRDRARSSPIFNYARVLQLQIEYLLTEATGSAVDNELALLFWPPYTRVRWQMNPLNARFAGTRTPQTLMVMRLDAPTAQHVRDLIANTLATEREGLKGRIALDARSLAPRDGAGKEDPMGIFDQKYRDLAELLEQKTTMPVTLDNRPEVFPATPAIEDVALYSGWYSLSNYVHAFRFNRGAVGYHVASFELTHLHGQHTGQWVRNLLLNGVVGTLGPVAEPYLHSFPPPEEFFPLLMTGKLTLAEVYWSTTPLTSWMQTCIGDPLYNPFAKSPVLDPQDLAPQLHKAVETLNSQAPAANGR